MPSRSSLPPDGFERSPADGPAHSVRCESRGRSVEAPPDRLVFRARERVSCLPAFCRSVSARAAGSRNTPPWKETAAPPDERLELCVSGFQTLDEAGELETLLPPEWIRTTLAARGRGDLCQFSQRRMARPRGISTGRQLRLARCGAVPWRALC